MLKTIALLGATTQAVELGTLESSLVSVEEADSLTFETIALAVGKPDIDPSIYGGFGNMQAVTTDQKTTFDGFKDAI